MCLQHDKNSTQYQLGIFYFDITCLFCDISEISFYFFCLTFIVSQANPYFHPYPIKPIPSSVFKDALCSFGEDFIFFAYTN